MASSGRQGSAPDGRKSTITRRRFIGRALALGLASSSIGAALSACGSGGPGRARAGSPKGSTSPSALTPQTSRQQAGKGTASLLFTFWGSPNEKRADTSAAASFNRAHPNIHVRAQHVPGDYVTKLTTMLASGSPPDLAYMVPGTVQQWASEGKILDLAPYFKHDTTRYLPSTFWRLGKDKILGISLAEIMLIFYNKDLFEEARMDPPPARADEAWTWDRFVDVARKLTKDTSGNDATSPKFDPKNIDTYGIAFPQGEYGYMPMIWSNGGRFANPEGTKLLLNEPEDVQVLQDLQDLICKYHVSPTPAQTQSMPATNIMMQSRKVAMDFDGHWAVLDYSSTKGLNWGIGVLPRYKKPVTMNLGDPLVVFSATKYPDQAFEFYKWVTSPEHSELFKDGLWLPSQLRYYTDPKWRSRWLEGKKGVYPPNSKETIADYTLHNVPLQPPEYWLKNQVAIADNAVTPAMDLLWGNKATAQQAMDLAVKKARPLMQGVWTPPQSV